MYQVAGFGRGSALTKDLERLPADWEREIIFHSKSIILCLEVFSWLIHIIHPFLQFLSIFAQRIQLAFRELSSILPFMDVSDTSISKCFFLEPILRVVGLALFGILHAHKFALSNSNR